MVAAIAMVKDEADIVAATVGHMSEQVDQVFVLDNGSTDGTSEILASLDVTVLDDPEPGYYQSHKLSMLAADARRSGAGWIVPFDADEFWFARAGGRIADALGALSEDILLAEADLFDHVPTAQDNGGLPAWRRDAAGVLPKVACRALDGLVIYQGNHAAGYPGIDLPLTVKNILTIRHFPYRSPEQMVRKARNGAAAYAATDLDPSVGAHWRQYGELLEAHGETALREVFFEYFHSDNPEDDGLIFDPVPLGESTVCSPIQTG